MPEGQGETNEKGGARKREESERRGVRGVRGEENARWQTRQFFLKKNDNLKKHGKKNDN